MEIEKNEKGLVKDSSLILTKLTNGFSLSLVYVKMHDGGDWDDYSYHATEEAILQNHKQLRTFIKAFGLPYKGMVIDEYVTVQAVEVSFREGNKIIIYLS